MESSETVPASGVTERIEQWHIPSSPISAQISTDQAGPLTPPTPQPHQRQIKLETYNGGEQSHVDMLLYKAKYEERSLCVERYKEERRDMLKHIERLRSQRNEKQAKLAEVEQQLAKVVQAHEELKARCERDENSQAKLEAAEQQVASLREQLVKSNQTCEKMKARSQRLDAVERALTKVEGTKQALSNTSQKQRETIEKQEANIKELRREVAKQDRDLLEARGRESKLLADRDTQLKAMVEAEMAMKEVEMARLAESISQHQSSAEHMKSVMTQTLSNTMLYGTVQKIQNMINYRHVFDQALLAAQKELGEWRRGAKQQQPGHFANTQQAAVHLRDAVMSIAGDTPIGQSLLSVQRGDEDIHGTAEEQIPGTSFSWPDLEVVPDAEVGMEQVMEMEMASFQADTSPLSVIDQIECQQMVEKLKGSEAVLLQQKEASLKQRAVPNKRKIC